MRLVLHLRGNRDLEQDDPREEIWEATGALIIDATLRRSQDLRFGLGLIARYHYASLAADVPDATAPRYELGVVIPFTAYRTHGVNNTSVNVPMDLSAAAVGDLGTHGLRSRRSGAASETEGRFTLRTLHLRRLVEKG